MSDEVVLGSDELSPRDERKYRELLDRSRRPVRGRETASPRPDMPSFQEIHQSNIDPAAIPGVPRMTEGELTEAVNREGGLRSETLEGLAALAKANAGQPVVEKKPAPAPVEEKAATEEKDLDEVFERVMRSTRPSSPVWQVYTEKRRKLIEGELSEISISDLLMSQDARQRVQVVKDVYAEFRSLNGHETEFAERWVWEQFHGSTSESHYALARGLVHLALTLTMIGKQKFPEHRDEHGQVREELFEKKHRALLRYPTFLIEALDINRLWFVERCAKILSVDAVGNG